MAEGDTIVRIPKATMERLDRIGLSLERARDRGQVHLHATDRFGVTTYAVIDHLALAWLAHARRRTKSMRKRRAELKAVKEAWQASFDKAREAHLRERREEEEAQRSNP